MWANMEMELNGCRVSTSLTRREGCAALSLKTLSVIGTLISSSSGCGNTFSWGQAGRLTATRKHWLCCPLRPLVARTLVSGQGAELGWPAPLAARSLAQGPSLPPRGAHPCRHTPVTPLWSHPCHTPVVTPLSSHPCHTPVVTPLSSHPRRHTHVVTPLSSHHLSHPCRHTPVVTPLSSHPCRHTERLGERTMQRMILTSH